mmetsp:Transcript_3253/g.10976  ORF Transcript_3253/g.10976 Transcript_3253/m.10976 type:complete len:233 (-) Transcript_3253:438-1136(-)|eukprot:scaffold2477_cov95-Isochrysis_galbana.AAC.4
MSGWKSSSGSASKRSRETRWAEKSSSCSTVARRGGHELLAGPPHSERQTGPSELARLTADEARASSTADSDTPSPTPSACAAAASTDRPRTDGDSASAAAAPSEGPNAGVASESPSEPGSGVALPSGGGCGTGLPTTDRGLSAAGGDAAGTRDSSLPSRWSLLSMARALESPAGAGAPSAAAATTPEPPPPLPAAWPSASTTTGVGTAVAGEPAGLTSCSACRGGTPARTRV